MKSLVVFMFLALANASSDDPQSVFNTVYERKVWGDYGGRSGPGSTMLYTVHVRSFLKRFIREHKIKHMVDAPCGSFLWMRDVVESIDDPSFVYSGFDVADSVVERLRGLNISRCTFERLDLTKDHLPSAADLIFSRDALQHLALLQIVRALENFKHASPRFLAVGSYPRGINQAINTGEYFSINLMREPFGLWPEYVVSEMVNEPEMVKHILIYTRSQIQQWDIASIESRVQSVSGDTKFRT